MPKMQKNQLKLLEKYYYKVYINAVKLNLIIYLLEVLKYEV